MSETPYYTEEQRLLFYKTARVVLEDILLSGLECGFCYALDVSAYGEDCNDGYDVAKWNEELPELGAYRPEDSRSYWFDTNRKGMKHRISILDSIIAKLEEKIQQAA